ncbi:MAG: class I SAM-dependent methyltransferase [Bacteroidales bacterium]|nr:class I SAM-dependent methyltransferase [Bacteroidales bacterium]
MLRKLFQNTRKPGNSIGGKIMLAMMNRGHKPLYDFGLKHINLNEAKEILDIGCGGGKIIKRMLRIATEAKIVGLDYSCASIKKTLTLNSKALKAGRCEATEGDVKEMPFKTNRFDVVTAFETVFFWDVEKAFAEVFRITKPGGRFYVLCELSDPQKGEKWTKMIDGMNIYTKEQIKIFMEKADFSDIKFFTKKDMICVTGLKK